MRPGDGSAGTVLNPETKTYEVQAEAEVAEAAEQVEQTHQSDIQTQVQYSDQWEGEDIPKGWQQTRQGTVIAPDGEEFVIGSNEMWEHEEELDEMRVILLNRAAREKADKEPPEDEDPWARLDREAAEAEEALAAHEREAALQAARAAAIAGWHDEFDWDAEAKLSAEQEAARKAKADAVIKERERLNAETAADIAAADAAAARKQTVPDEHPVATHIHDEPVEPYVHQHHEIMSWAKDPTVPQHIPLDVIASQIAGVKTI